MFCSFWAVVLRCLFILAFLPSRRRTALLLYRTVPAVSVSGSYLARTDGSNRRLRCVDRRVSRAVLHAPYAGALITAACMTLSGIIAQGAFCGGWPSSDAFLLYLLPPLALLRHFDANLPDYHGTWWLSSSLSCSLLLYMDLKSFRGADDCRYADGAAALLSAGAAATLCGLAAVLSTNVSCMCCVFIWYLLLRRAGGAGVYLHSRQVGLETVRFTLHALAISHHELIAPHHLLLRGALLFIILVAFHEGGKRWAEQLVIDSAVHLVVLVLSAIISFRKYRDTASTHPKHFRLLYALLNGTRSSAWAVVRWTTIFHQPFSIWRYHKGELASSMFSLRSAWRERADVSLG